MAEERRAGLIAGLDLRVRGALAAVRAFARTLRARAPGRTPPALAPHFGEHERLEELRYYPPAPPRESKPERGELPDSYGKTRLVLRTVDPNLVHASWEIAPGKLEQARRRIGSPARAVLRFHGAGQSFDVDVDLGSRNSYVPLWSAGKSYSVDLGLKTTDGGFAQLAGSSVVHTPRALPVVEVDARFMRVESAPARAEIVPAPYGPPLRLREKRPAPPSPAVPPGADSPGAGSPRTAPPPSGSAPIPPRWPRPVDSAQMLRRKLAELYAFREWHTEPLKPPEAPSRQPVSQGAGEPGPDLTELSEKRHVMGLSSTALDARHPEK